MTQTRKRLSAQESRTAALEAASDLLREEGPQAVTLKAVAARVSRTHANLLHHFGSAGGLQQALAEHLASAVCREIATMDKGLRGPSGAGSVRDTVDAVFRAYSARGGGALAAWMLSTGQPRALDPVIGAVHGLMERLGSEGDGAQGGAAEVGGQRRELTLAISLLALGESLLGGELASALGADRASLRGHGERMVSAALALPGGA